MDATEIFKPNCLRVGRYVPRALYPNTLPGSLRTHCKYSFIYFVEKKKINNNIVEFLQKYVIPTLALFTVGVPWTVTSTAKEKKL